MDFSSFGIYSMARPAEAILSKEVAFERDRLAQHASKTNVFAAKDMTKKTKKSLDGEKSTKNRKTH